MPIVNRIADFHAEMTAWRRDMHANPETAFEEHRTAGAVARLLQSFGIEVETGVAGTGVIGSLTGAAPGGRAIALRADMDALPHPRTTGSRHASQNAGRMHACGHDGHTTMLLGAARYLAETRNFAGTVHFIFQPAEENEGGARLMVEEGLFERFPVEAVYRHAQLAGVAGRSVRDSAGPDDGRLRHLRDHGHRMRRACGDAASRHRPDRRRGADRHRAADDRQPQHPSADAAVVSVTQFHGGDTWNVIPDEVVLRGTARSFDPRSGR